MEIFNSAFAKAVRASQDTRTNYPILIGGAAEQITHPENLLLTATALTLCSVIESIRELRKVGKEVQEPEPELKKILLEIGTKRVGGIKYRP